MALTRKQQVFVDEYLKTWNASDAARRAGYSRKTAGSIGSENLTKPEIAQEIERRLAEIKMSADEVLTRLADQARTSMDDFVTGGSIDLGKAGKAGKMHLIKKLRRSDKGISIELYDAQAALALLARHHHLLDGAGDGPVTVILKVVRDDSN